MPVTFAAAPAELHERIAFQDLTFNKKAVLSRFAVFNLSKPRAHLLQMLIVTVHECRPSMFTQPVIKFTLGTLNPLERAKAQKVCLTYVGNKPVIRLAYLDQFPDIAGMTGAHLDNGILMLGFKSYDRKRNTN